MTKSTNSGLSDFQPISPPGINYELIGTTVIAIPNFLKIAPKWLTARAAVSLESPSQSISIPDQFTPVNYFNSSNPKKIII